MKTELYKNVNDVVGFEVKETRENSVCLVKRCKIDEVCNGRLHYLRFERQNLCSVAARIGGFIQKYGKLYFRQARNS